MNNEQGNLGLIINTNERSDLTDFQDLSSQKALKIIIELCRELTIEKINYCHWKSNEALARSASGENDLDLLISRADALKFTEILFRLGFHEAQAFAGRKLPGILDYYGFDTETNRLIHVHAHYQLVLGNDLSKNYRIPLELPYLDSAIQSGLFRIPAPEFELVILVIRLVLKHNTWDSILMRQGSLSASERRELNFLATPENLVKAGKVLEQHLPYMSSALFASCLQILQSACSLVKRIRTGEQVKMALKACARYSRMLDIVFKLWHRVWWPVQQRVFKPKRRLANGGLLIAIVGGDGSGKTTVIDGLHRLLSKKFDVMTLHMGKPSWSWTTIATRGCLKIGTMLGLYPFSHGSLFDDNPEFPGYPWLIRSVCTARDRYLTYLKAMRFSSNGGLVICDRYAIPNLLMDAPQCARMAKAFKRSNWFLQWLTKMEEAQYRQIAMPDLLIVLHVDPEISVQRKTDETAVSVRARSTLVWKFDWDKTPAVVLDASLTKEEVLAQVQALIWKYL